MVSIDDVPDDEIPDYAALGRLDGRTYVVLGGGRGIGRQAAHALSQAGGVVACVDQDERRAEAVAHELGADPWVCDVTQRSQVADLFQQVERRYGQVNGVVDIVGLPHFEDLKNVDDEHWHNEFGIVLRHALYAIQYGAASIEKTQLPGAMVFVASISGLVGAPRHGPYGAAKAGLMSLVKTAAVEYADSRIRLNAIAPGVTLTPRIRARISPQELCANEENSLIGRLGTPIDVAAIAAFLLSDLSAFVNGQTIVADGGVSVKFPHPISHP
jgi:NAD(P)-dependent dehydrogenase (short-subunit alcohol dehydrogenase family)